MPPAAAHPLRQGKANFGAYQALSEPPAPLSAADLAFPPLPNTISHPPGHSAGGSPSLVAMAESSEDGYVWRKPSEKEGAGKQPVSFAAAVSKPRLMQRFPPISLPRRQYGCEDGEPVVHFTSAEFEAGAALFKFSLIAKFTVGRPTMEEIRNTLKNCWVVKGRVTLSEIWDGRHIMVILDSEEDATAALTCPVRKIGHAMFRLFRYSPEYNPKRESTITAKWVRLHGLHPAFFTRAYVGAIVNSFGTFLDLDACTKACAGMKFARACVELDVTVPIPDRVKLTLSDGRFFWQKIEVEGNTSYCSYCKLHGHELALCRKKKTPKLYEGPVERDNLNKGLKVDGQKHHAGTIPVTITGNSNVSSQPHATQKGKAEWVQVKKKNAARVVGFKTSEVAMEKGVSLPSVFVLTMEDNEVEEAQGNPKDFAAVVQHQILYNKGEINEENNDDESSMASTEGMDSKSSSEDENDKRHSSEMHLSEETAKKISSYGDLIYSAEEGGQIDPKAIYMYLRKAGEDESTIFEYLDNLVNEIRQVQQDDSGTPFEESGNHDDQVESVDPSMLSNSLSLKKTRQGKKKKKKKGSR